MAADHRHPRCVTPSGGTSSDAATIADLRRELADLKLQREADLAETAATCEAMRAEIVRMTDELSHATAHDGDHLSKASRGMCETVLGERDALRAKVRDLEALVNELRCGDLGPFFDDELSPERAEAFRVHLAACETCQQDLEGQMQLDARLSALAESREPHGGDNG